MKKGSQWRTIRAVVEVKVPPQNPTTERDLRHQVSMALKGGLFLPREHYPDRYQANPKVKGFTHVFRAEAKRPSRSDFERLVLHGIWIIVSILLPGKAREQGQLKAWKDEARALTGSTDG